MYVCMYVYLILHVCMSCVGTTKKCVPCVLLPTKWSFYNPQETWCRQTVDVEHMTSFIQNASTACGWLGSLNDFKCFAPLFQGFAKHPDIYRPSSKLCRQRHQLWFLWSYWRWQRISSAFARLLPSPPGSGPRVARKTVSFFQEVHCLESEGCWNVLGKNQWQLDGKWGVVLDTSFEKLETTGHSWHLPEYSSPKCRPHQFYPTRLEMSPATRLQTTWK